MRLHEFWAELRRRRVVRVGAVYGAVSLATIQAADALVPALRLPESATTLVVFLLILGFPIAVALTWVLEITPDGIRRTAPLEAGAVPPAAPRRRSRDLAALPGDASRLRFPSFGEDAARLLVEEREQRYSVPTSPR